MIKVATLILAVAALSLAGCSSGGGDAATAGTTSSAANNPPTGTSGYAAVQATLTTNCIECHGADSPKAGLSLTSYEGVMKGGNKGPVVIAGNPDQSEIINVLAAGAKPHMPPKAQLDQAKIDAIKAWIKDGAKQG